MNQVKVQLKESYTILIGDDLLDHAGEHIRGLTSSPRIAIVTDDIVAELYLQRLENSLRKNGFDSICSYVFENGEHSKTLETAGKIYDFLAKHNITRSDLVIALGGGVVGDVTGFAASTFLRGLRYVQIPTTLLAQVDSSVGGKTAVDLSSGKNLVGTFWQPSLVLCDISLLSTLGSDIFADGAAEVIKYGAIRDKELFEMIASSDYAEHLEEIIHRCICIKRDIVQMDEFDTGERMLLNFGHTLAHAIENHSNYSIPHGKAVAVGMVMITKASTKAGITPVGATEALERACNRFGLPTTVDFDLNQLVEICLNDKKRDNMHINVILLNQIGDAHICKMQIDDFRNFICEGCK
ncbi:3-dehydroquinate synthase [Hydrogenoanaerobacterium sp.]|uniref:3-dehydroquinate synthase n=1 Tax=Hydrogenoanaerobacterium sp. TaxID=2953763 RepID=UPI00289E4B5A|nr:3-dehydroquinate synthase [Hydrogenoanaerobacterium sp.]